MYIVPHVVGLQWFQDYSCWGGWGGGGGGGPVVNAL